MRVRTFAVCASSRAARETLSRRAPDARLITYMPGEWAVAHLRDGCTFLPFVGRRAGPPLFVNDGQTVDLRIPTAASSRGLWPVLNIDPAIAKAVRAVGHDVAARLSHELQRRPTVRDLAALGVGVSAAVRPDQNITAATPLTELALG